MNDTTFDYIIVGAGAAGSVLANRLSENPKNSVLLLEFGGSDGYFMHRIPKGFFFTLNSDRYAYRYPTKPFRENGEGEVWARGKVTGGSTTINGMMYMRGFARDWDPIAEDNPGWGWRDILPIYRGMENHVLGASEVRGGDGPYGVSFAEIDDVSRRILDAGWSAGYEIVEDNNATDSKRIGMTPSSVRYGKRVSAASAFLHPVLRRKNLTYQTRTRVGFLTFEGNQVTGVLTQHKGKQQTYTARKEVILAGGSVETTMLLERSGIGRGDALTKAGVRPRIESPNVGERVIEQRGVAMQVKFKEPIGLTQRLNSTPKQGWEGFKYLLTGKGPVADAGYNLLAGMKSSDDLAAADIQGLFVPMALDAESFDKVQLAEHSGAMFMGYQIKPTTESSIHITGANPDTPPVVDAHYLESELDRKVTSTILDRGREVFAQSALADLISEEEYPGPAVSTEEQVLDYALNNGATIYHAVGAAAMGPNDDDVVDSRLRVRGVSGLRVADASVLPTQVSGNTAAPVMAVGWRASDFILDDN
ncbi:MAG: GMC family oxidoreductase N-terminal domain-containing protein [Yaniella sp.]|uniref:GMC family oxidoreductase n=1 Tax=Yaniella sp. TaxID=2773929 RepID=UPI002648B825|nr:GMC family oxidoreductase N-terminal domain-containing protein [Yaniella sp.]MDN5704164.1 GMC family oxidoreductase N-terminal domain-containing protein [Yaniella sp.]MDN5731499.1 GMC family oxidoreductase N-terminal domain-containing protein [Yaniella sp.]MDN5742104.1 GMC family oxidoreductase N-terminal domain-containing protein [Yaniella sp.]MDN5815362.1 GMC family oxidoreductase N-terminal domain-containing protein [Yaniella sp.]MDN5817034.1 GMC family oxidoreductase N-terminal domain-c